jgi:hypothetical protein
MASVEDRHIVVVGNSKDLVNQVLSAGDVILETAVGRRFKAQVGGA